MNWMYENAAIVATIDPQTVNSTQALSDAIDMSKWSEVMAIFLLGDMAAETIDCRLQEATTSGGTYQALKSATQLAAHATNNDNKQIIICVKAEELSSGYQYLKARMVTGNTTGGPAACVVLARPRYAPGSDDDLSDVVEIKA